MDSIQVENTLKVILTDIESNPFLLSTYGILSDFLQDNDYPEAGEFSQLFVFIHDQDCSQEIRKNSFYEIRYLLYKLGKKYDSSNNGK